MQAIQQMLLSMGGSVPTLLIQSIQQVSIVIAAGATSNTATISSVTPANCARLWAGETNPNNNAQNSAIALGSVVLTNSTTVTAQRNTLDASFALTVNCTILEFVPGVVKSVQSGTITMTAATSNTATISSVTTTNSAVAFNGVTATYTGSVTQQYATALVLTNATTITASRIGSTSNITAYYTALEFNSGVLNSNTQAGSATITNSTSGTGTISSVTTGQSMLIWGGNTTTDAASGSDHRPWLTLTNGTTVTAAHTTAGTDTNISYFTVLEFKSVSVKTMNRGSIVIGAGSISNTATITAVTTAKTVTNWLGQTAASAVVTAATSDARVVLTNTTTITASRGIAYGPAGMTVGHETIEFN